MPKEDAAAAIGHCPNPGKPRSAAQDQGFPRITRLGPRRDRPRDIPKGQRGERHGNGFSAQSQKDGHNQSNIGYHVIGQAPCGPEAALMLIPNHPRMSQTRCFMGLALSPRRFASASGIANCAGIHDHHHRFRAGRKSTVGSTVTSWYKTELALLHRGHLVRPGCRSGTGPRPRWSPGHHRAPLWRCVPNARPECP